MVHNQPENDHIESPAARIAAWQRQSGRHDLPWQKTHDPYRIWLSEIMLQQTQAVTVIPYYQRFLSHFPDVVTLARAQLDQVLQLWAGLGYYARARNLHRCAQVVYTQYGGHFPRSWTELALLPGIGPSTAAAIAAFAWEERAAILDGNVRRVLARYAAIEGAPERAATIRQLWSLAHTWLDTAPADLDMRAYTQGQMDLGATICTRTRPSCQHCPLAPDCQARLQGRQAELPTPRAKRTQARRTCWLLLAQSESHILLHKRPPSGIWGGLWSLPEFTDFNALKVACNRLATPSAIIERMASIDHVFSHFRLHMQPYRMQLDKSLLPTPEPHHHWVALAQLGKHGMPAPVAQLLSGL